MTYGWSGTHDRTYNAPKIDGTPNFNHEFGYDFANENWYFEDLLSIGSISSGNITAGNSTTSAYIRSHYSDGSYMTLQGYGLEMNRTTSYIRPTTDGNKTLYVGGVDASLDWASIQFRSLLGLYMTGTKFLDASRNLVNIGTISSGAITSSGTVNAQILSASSEIFLGASSLGKISQSGNNWIFNTWANSQYNERLRITDSGITVSGTTITEGIDTSSHIYIDNDRDINFRKADGTTDGTILTRAGGNATRFKYGGNSFIFDSIENKNWRIYNSSGDFIFSVIPTSNATSSSTRVYGKLQIGTTTVIDNARNLTNINSMYVAGYIYHTGDTDTNIVFSDDTITLNAGGQGTTFKGNGRVGIGVVNPTEKLHVEGNIELQNNGYIGSLDEIIGKE